MLTGNRGSKSFAVIWIVLGLALVGAAQPDWQEQDKLLASDGAADDYFGDSVSISGDYAIVGAYGDDDKGDLSGSAYIFKRVGTNWIEQQKLLPSYGAADDYFGCSVSISGDYAIVGAVYDDDNGEDSGSAYIFVGIGRTWTQQQKLIASDGAAHDRFGDSVSISGDYAIVGAYGDDDNGEHSGSAYLFKRYGTAWAQQQKLLASDGDTSDYFGWSVSISGDYAIVGADNDDDNEQTGSAYIFKRVGTAWAQQQKLLASDGGYRFGDSVSISGDYAIVGAAGGSPPSGYGAYIFKRVGTVWTEQQKLLVANEPCFGISVSISGDYAIVGAPIVFMPTTPGSAYLFKRYGTAWVQQQKLLASDGAAGDGFGRSVSISGDYAIVGAQFDDNDNGGGSGSAYIYESVTSPIHRFWSPVNLRHFYTISQSEKNKLIVNYSHVWSYEGVAYYAFSDMGDRDVVPVYRFWSDALAAHFYTISESEKNKLISNYSDVWTFEGPAFYAYPPGQEPYDASAVYRFWSDSLGCHFYTIKDSEKDKLIFQYSHVWAYEGTAWYAYK